MSTGTDWSGDPDTTTVRAIAHPAASAPPGGTAQPHPSGQPHPTDAPREAEQHRVTELHPSTQRVPGPASGTAPAAAGATHAAAPQAPRPDSGPLPGVTVDVGPRSFVLGPDQYLTVGRDADCHVLLSDARVSRHHVSIERDATGRVLVIDHGSSNGSFIGTRRLRQEEVVGASTTVWLGAAEPAGIPVRITMPPPLPDDAGRNDTTTTQTISVGQSSVITIGRGATNTIVLDDPLVSREHAQVVRKGNGFLVTDLDSLNGLQLNGVPTKVALLGPHDVLTIGRASFRAVDGQLQRREQREANLVASELCFDLPSGRRLLDRVSFAAEGAQLVAVIGPSGAGKSTLLKALTGSQPATSGRVVYDGSDLYTNYANLRQRIGVVPQDDVVHRQLTVRQALTYAAELRLPGDYTAAARTAEVDRVMADLDLHAHESTQISRLSGGQRKRASVALELLTQPNLLLLDEPTSGLDPNLDRSVMSLLRNQADGGRTVVVITHSVANLDMCDAVLILAPGGKVAYYGPPQRVLEYFGVTDYADVFALVADRPDDVANAFAASSLVQPMPALPPAMAGGVGVQPTRGQSHRRQWSTLIRRQFRIVTSDRSYAIATLLLPLFIAVMAMAVPGHAGFGRPPVGRFGEASQLLVVTIVGAAFMGMSASIRELVAERAIFLRERAVGLSPRIYLLAKVCVLVLVALVQSVLLVGLVRAAKHGPAGASLLGSGTLELMVSAFATALASALVGLMLSAFVGTSEQAMPALVLSVMFQLVMCGGLIQVSGRLAMQVISAIAPARWGFAMGASTVDLESLNPNAAHDWLNGHHAGPWLTSLAALGVLCVLSFLLAARRLRRQAATA